MLANYYFASLNMNLQWCIYIKQFLCPSKKLFMLFCALLFQNVSCLFLCGHFVSYLHHTKTIMSVDLDIESGCPSPSAVHQCYTLHLDIMLVMVRNDIHFLRGIITLPKTYTIQMYHKCICYALNKKGCFVLCAKGFVVVVFLA